MERAFAFAENLRYYRTKLGLTQKQLAEQIGYTEKSVSKWESGGALPTMEMVLKLADLFNLSLDELFFEDISCYYFLGIDGGGTKTAFKLTDKNGTLLNRVSKGPSNPYDIGIEQAQAIPMTSVLSRPWPYSRMESTRFAKAFPILRSPYLPGWRALALWATIPKL